MLKVAVICLGFMLEFKKNWRRVLLLEKKLKMQESDLILRRKLSPFHPLREEEKESSMEIEGRERKRSEGKKGNKNGSLEPC